MKELLQQGQLDVAGQLVDASNMTLLAKVEGVECIYKPVSGEAPLWDFPDATLAKREVAAYEISRLFPVALIPMTVWRDTGPFGPGMCQEFVETVALSQLSVDVLPYGQTPEGFIEILQARDSRGQHVVLVHENRSDLRWMALLDAVINNADRKGGHILHVGKGVMGIDHGVTFHVEPKLRTVLWGWAGEELTREELEVLATVENNVDDVLRPWISEAEIRACARRIQELVVSSRFPLPSPSWPSIPWPVF